METWGYVLNEEKCHGFTEFQQGCIAHSGLILFCCESQGFGKVIQFEHFKILREIWLVTRSDLLPTD